MNIRHTFFVRICYLIIHRPSTVILVFSALSILNAGCGYKEEEFKKKKEILSAIATNNLTKVRLLLPKEGAADFDTATYKAFLDLAAEKFFAAEAGPPAMKRLPIIGELSRHLRHIKGRSVVVTGTMGTNLADQGNGNFTSSMTIESKDKVSYRLGISTQETEYKNVDINIDDQQFLIDFDATYKIYGVIVGEILEAEKVEVISKRGNAGQGMVVPVSLMLPSTVNIVNAENERHQSITRTFTTAVQAGNLATIQTMLKGDPNLIFSKDSAGGTLLNDAANMNRKDIVKFLLAKGLNINAKDSLGMTPLHEAANSNLKDIVELLLAKGADINARDAKGMTPLYWSVSPGHKEMVELLLANGADVNSKSNFGYTPLHAALLIDAKDIALLLRQHGGHQ